MAAKRWRVAAGAAVMGAALVAMPVEAQTRVGDDVTMTGVLPGTLTTGTPRASFDPVQRNISDPPPLTPKRNPESPTPRPGPGGMPDPSRKTFVVPPSQRDSDKPATFSYETPASGFVPLFEQWSPGERFDFQSGYPITVPSSRSFEPKAPVEPLKTMPEDAYAERLRHRVMPAVDPRRSAPAVGPSAGSKELD